MRRFVLNRRQDTSGISGTGIVAEGVQLSSGKCILSWYTRVSSVNIYESIEDLIFIHGHGGNSVIDWIDKDAAHGRAAGMDTRGSGPPQKEAGPTS